VKDPIRVPPRAVVAIQGELIAEHGGLSGPPGPDDLEAALSRPANLFSYSETRPSLPRPAAAYGFALARGHCFPDGNKRVALAAGDLSEDELAEWIAAHKARVR
jgi:death-on-curing protein